MQTYYSAQHTLGTMVLKKIKKKVVFKYPAYSRVGRKLTQPKGRSAPKTHIQEADFSAQHEV